MAERRLLPAFVAIAGMALVAALLVIDQKGASAAAPAAGEDAGAPGIHDCPAGEPFSRDHLSRDVRYLASGKRAGRAPGTEGDRDTRAYIEARFRCLGLLPAGEGGGYQDPFRTSEGDRTANVVGVLPGRNPDRRRGAIVVGAHHDHIGTQGGRIFRGANDNASGTAGLLSVATELSRRKRPLKRPVIFAAFGAEETLESAPFLEGSVRFVRNPPLGFRRKDIGFMVNMDMLGTYRNRDEAHIFGPRPGSKAYRVIRRENRGKGSINLRFPGNAGAGLSDYWPFQRRGIPTAFFHTPDGICLHEFCDVPSRIGYGTMGRLTRLVSDSVERMAR